jgi:hypothetical protein
MNHCEIHTNQHSRLITNSLVGAVILALTLESVREVVSMDSRFAIRSTPLPNLVGLAHRAALL